ncbi:preprotein translocase subunit SecY [uncultured Tyzzerella sp.]|uniref:preprotein translocase subunit SecY n=1 Tax=uncultured Tyzzerella sp. TaxID=2321398 RepID=UPI002943A433|nr:preprotein translocase subunit SecY [uncultured Tyzzerella sp.]
MFSTFRNAWKVPDLRKRIIFMILMTLVIRIGTKITVPGINIADLSTNSNNTLYNIITGGAFGTIFALGIGPYITSSIIMQLLTVAIPKLEQLNKEGEQGRKIINKYTRVLAVVLAFMQATGQILSLKGAFVYQNAWVYFVAALSMVAGTILVMWLGERLTEKGIGNGTSFIIFANILASLPNTVKTIYVDTVGGGTAAYIKAAIIIVLFILLIAFVILVQDGERRIPVQYSKKMVGRKMYGGQSTFIPIKVNIAGVMSIIFAISILQFPQTIAQLWQTPPNWLQEVVRILNITNPIGAILYIILIFCFTSFYTSFSFNPIEVAENMKKNGGFIPGIRPGKPTSDFIQNVVNKISLIGACFYAVIAIVPVLFEWIFKVNVGFGGTTLLIITGVALEIVKQLDSQLLMRNYKGFLG